MSKLSQNQKNLLRNLRLLQKNLRHHQKIISPLLQDLQRVDLKRDIQIDLMIGEDLKGNLQNMKNKSKSLRE